MTAHLIGYEIACDGPTDTDDCPGSAAVCIPFGARTAAQVRAAGREQGWTRPRGHDRCPTCTAKSKEPSQ
ncbi:hypothetical protein [Streptomyces sp. NPDC059783]|uniref:hypothetical protein n=1 Tax=Streptomyces sp. NPDC059783 TaxID=3346944 RepID=UPI0036490245